MTDGAPSTMRGDIVSAYAATAARVGAWIVVAALVFRRLGADAFAVLALVRAMLGLLNYVSIGIGPAVIRLLAENRSQSTAQIESPGNELSYASRLPGIPGSSAARAVYGSAARIIGITALLGFIVIAFYSEWFDRLHPLPGNISAGEVRQLAFWFGCGVIVRIASDVSGAILQALDRISADNLIVATADIAWAACVAAWMLLGSKLGWLGTMFEGLFGVGMWYFAAALCQYVVRSFWASRELGGSVGLTPGLTTPSDRKTVWRLVRMGLLITTAQVADFLYAPTDYVLIGWLLNPSDVATYAPAVQIDSTLLLAVAALGSVLLPKTATAHTSGRVEDVRRYYVRGTLGSVLVLAVAAACAWIASDLIFELWLGDTLPATRAILPLVLVHTVIGGSGMVGRSILLGMGKVKPFTISVLIAGVSNVVLSYCFVKYFNLGLRGIIYGTIVAVVARCGLWMPWYILRTLRREVRSAKLS